MKTMQEWLDAYGESHQNPINKGFHWLCVPVIFFTIIGLLSLIPTGLSDVFSGDFPGPYLHIGAAVILLGVLFFLRLSVSIATGMLVFSMLVLYFVNVVNIAFPGNAVYIYLILFVLAWVGQFIGHKIEGKKPSFFDDLKFLLIGPAWLLHFVYRKLRIPV